MNEQESHIDTHIWTHATSLAELLRAALAEQQREHAAYFLGELHRIGALLFDKISDASKEETALELPEPASLPTKNSEKLKTRTINLNKPITDDEKRILEITLLSEHPPADLGELTKAFGYIYHTKNKGVYCGRTKKLLTRALQRICHVYAKTRLYETDQEFVAKVRSHFVGVSAYKLEAVAKKIMQRYTTTPQFTTPIPKHPRFLATGGTTDWLQLLENAFLHTDGPSLEPAVLCARTELPQELVQPMLDGALDSLRGYTNGTYISSPPPDVTQFIKKLSTRWPHQHIDDIIATIQ